MELSLERCYTSAVCCLNNIGSDVNNIETDRYKFFGFDDDFCGGNLCFYIGSSLL